MNDFEGKKKMNNLGRSNWVLMFGLLAVGMMVFVMATTPIWESGSDSTNYTTVEENIYVHNFSANITGFNNDVNFTIDTATDISWTNGSGTYNVLASAVSKWILMTSALTGNLTINATYDNQTGFFVIPIQATNTTDGLFSGAPFEFIINATNDAPNFTSSGITDSYSFDSDESLQTFFLNATDEEDHFPLSFNITFNSTNCTHGANTGYADNTNCSLFDFGLTLADIVNESANISFAPNSSHIGTYWANVSVMDAATLYNCPHDWCDATYNETNLITYYSEMVKFTVEGVLSINVSNCTGETLIEGEQFNCIIVITTPGENDNLTLSSNAGFRTDTSNPDDASWFYADNSVSAINFNYNVSISIIPSKVDVGNWSINFTADNGMVSAAIENILIYVNYTEFNVTLDAIGDLSGSNALYENYTFQVNATDEDLLILDTTVKAEVLTFDSNESDWVTYESKTTGSGDNYNTATFKINYDYILGLSGVGNYSVLINVTDDAGNFNESVFVIEILNTSAPVWDSGLGTPVNLSLIEGNSFTYNVSMNVSDNDENDTLTFYYENVSAEFCSLNSTNFNSTSGIINFTPTDCDVGYHNVTITATDGKLNSSHQFNFTVSNIADTPSIVDTNADSVTFNNGDGVNATEASEVTFELVVDDYDFLIPSGQESFYNESLTIDVIATRSNGTEENLFEFSFVEFGVPSDQSVSYNASFTSTGTQVDNYTIVINITDNSSLSITRTFYLNISEIFNYPNITTIGNHSVTIYDYLNFTVNATDDEDDPAGLNLSYSITNLSVGSPNLTIGNESGIVAFDMGSNNFYSGIWQYNVTVMDSDSQISSESFYLYVYGLITLVNSSQDSVFNSTENTAGVLNFTINHSVADNLTYEFWIDSINCSYQNNSDCDYGNLTPMEITSSFGNGSIYGWSFTPNYTDETYGNYKNLTVSVYPNTTSLNSTQLDSVATNFTFKLNVSHINAPVSFTCNYISDGSTTWLQDLEYNLSSCFSDVDASDSYYLQSVNFSVESSSSPSNIDVNDNRIPTNISYNSWQLNFSTSFRTSETSEIVILTAGDINSSTNETIDTVTSNNFTVTFTAPVVETVTVPRSRGSTTKLKHFSLKLIVPQDIIISDMNYIDIPFTVQNNGEIDLKGINLNSFVRFNDEFSDDVKISLADNYIELLKFGQAENFTMRILANTQRAGKYKATILANVTSPKLSDWGEFFIELRKTNESEAEQILIFTEKLISENPECLELTELLRRAEEEFSSGDYFKAVDLARQATEACEDAIITNEQIKYPITGFVKDNFYYISFSTLVIFLLGFIFYVYKRVRFNKYKVDEYI